MNAMEIPRGVGTGFVWDTRGHIITNAHVVESSTKVSVTLQGSTRLVKASVVGRDRDKDVAVLKLELPEAELAALRPVTLGCSSNLLVGQTVYALGNPFGLDLSLTRGVVSGLGRELGSSSRRTPITNVIQTDAAINPGNSGGPLLDSRGRLVGINTAILDPTGAGSFSGVGFAIPIDAVKGMVDQILQYGRVRRPALGISIAPAPALRSPSGPSQPQPSTSGGGARGARQAQGRGVLVVNVRSGGPADVAGIQPTRREMFGRVALGDVITAVNGQPVRNEGDLYRALDAAAVGDTVSVELAPRDTVSAWPPGYASPPPRGARAGEGGARTVRVVLADRQKMQWWSE